MLRCSVPSLGGYFDGHIASTMWSLLYRSGHLDHALEGYTYSMILTSFLLLVHYVATTLPPKIVPIHRPCPPWRNTSIYIHESKESVLLRVYSVRYICHWDAKVTNILRIWGEDMLKITKKAFLWCSAMQYPAPRHQNHGKQKGTLFDSKENKVKT